MYPSFTQTIIVALLATTSALAAPSESLSARAEPKANEYKSADCSGPINYGHHAAALGPTTMDSTSHSVYLAGVTWYGFGGIGLTSGDCSGDYLGYAQAPASLPGGCVNLDTLYSASRINCVSQNGISGPILDADTGLGGDGDDVGEGI